MQDAGCKGSGLGASAPGILNPASCILPFQSTKPLEGGNRFMAPILDMPGDSAAIQPPTITNAEKWLFLQKIP
jgi:hypothetical protein